jgi:transposase
MNHTSETGDRPFAAYVAIDWADRKHAWALQIDGSTKIEHGELTHTPEAVQAWAAGLQERFPRGMIAVGLEQKRGALVAMLTQYAHLVIFPIEPQTSARYRRAFFPSGAKSDAGDAVLLLELLTRHRSRFSRLPLDTALTRQLQFLTADRRKFVDQRTAFSNQLTAQLKLIFPQALTWFGAAHSPLMMAFLSQWPTLAALQAAKRGSVTRFCKEHGIAKVTPELIRQAVPATKDPALLESAKLAMQTLVAQLVTLAGSISAYDSLIETLTKQHPDRAIFASFPGVGRVLVPRLIAALGTDRQRFRSAEALQCYSGIAPVQEASGKQCWVHRRWTGPIFVQQTMFEMAHHSLRFCGWAKAYYDALRERGKGHHAAVRALAFKWLRILFRCWQNRQPYDDAHYVKSLVTQQRHVPTPSSPAWISCGSFAKFTGLKP